LALPLDLREQCQLTCARQDPVAVVLDEPFAGMDPLAVEALSAIFAELAAGASR
jgi:ABC-type lipopolysaccharide export system ATPase subunit